MSTPARPRVSLSFVCLGNICRSPTAEAVMRHLVGEARLDGAIHIESAGLGDWHVGEPRDARSAEVGRRRGIPLSGVARHFTAKDFARLDLILAMDRSNLRGLKILAPDESVRGKIHLLRAFDPAAPANAEVPDPYYGGPQGFDEVFDLCLAACRGLLDRLRRDHGLG